MTARHHPSTALGAQEWLARQHEGWLGPASSSGCRSAAAPSAVPAVSRVTSGSPSAGAAATLRSWWSAGPQLIDDVSAHAEPALALVASGVELVEED